MKNLGALRQERPRIMTSDTEEKKDLYRAGMHAELQKFKDTQKTRQLMLGEGVEPDKIDQNIEVTGLDLTESEDRALSAIQKLLSKTDYKGN